MRPISPSGGFACAEQRLEKVQRLERCLPATTIALRVGQARVDCHRQRRFALRQRRSDRRREHLLFGRNAHAARRAHGRHRPLLVATGVSGEVCGRRKRHRLDAWRRVGIVRLVLALRAEALLLPLRSLALGSSRALEAHHAHGARRHIGGGANNVSSGATPTPSTAAAAAIASKTPVLAATAASFGSAAAKPPGHVRAAKALDPGVATLLRRACVQRLRRRLGVDGLDCLRRELADLPVEGLALGWIWWPAVHLQSAGWRRACLLRLAPEEQRRVLTQELEELEGFELREHTLVLQPARQVSRRVRRRVRVTAFERLGDLVEQPLRRGVLVRGRRLVYLAVALIAVHHRRHGLLCDLARSIRRAQLRSPAVPPRTPHLPPPHTGTAPATSPAARESARPPRLARRAKARSQVAGRAARRGEASNAPVPALCDHHHHHHLPRSGLPRPAAPPPREMWRGGTRARVPVKWGGKRQIKTLRSLKSSPAFPGNICT